jgi:hypothetical protein
VEHASERGDTLAETAIAVAIAATVCAAVLAAAVSSLHAAVTLPVRSALRQALAREMHVALDVVKYQGASIPPLSLATALPMPAGTPLPAQLSVSTAKLANGAIIVTVTAAAADGSGIRQSLSARLSRQAPPGAQVVAPGLAPAPTGAP